MTGKTDRVWFVTGASSGIGKSLGMEILKRGERVAVTARDAERLDAVFHQSDRALPLSLEVADAAQCRDAVSKTRAAFGKIDVLVNNAGHGMAGAVEEVTDAEAKLVFDSNVFGLLKVVRAVLPSFRAARAGFVVNIGSVGGIRSRAGMGIYSATKFAVEAISEALFYELKPLGIGTMVVEPGPFRTDFLGRSMMGSAARIDDYTDTAWALREDLMARHGTQQGDPDRAARIIVDAVDTENPPLHLVLGKPALDQARAKLHDLLEEIDRWESVSASADYD